LIVVVIILLLVIVGLLARDASTVYNGRLGVGKSIIVIVLFISSTWSKSSAGSIREEFEVNGFSTAGTDGSNVILVVVVSKVGLTTLHVLLYVELVVVVVVLVVVVVPTVGKSSILVALAHTRVIVPIVVLTIAVLLHRLTLGFLHLLLGLCISLYKFTKLHDVISPTSTGTAPRGRRTKLEVHKMLNAKGAATLLVSSSTSSFTTIRMNRMTRVELDGMLGEPSEIFFILLVDTTSLGEEVFSFKGVR
jgi:hypothetical protein